MTYMRDRRRDDGGRRLGVNGAFVVAIAVCLFFWSAVAAAVWQAVH